MRPFARVEAKFDFDYEWRTLTGLLVRKRNEWVNKWVNGCSQRSVFFHLSLMNECRIVCKAEIGSLFLSLLSMPLYSNQADEESKKEKARTIPLATLGVGVSSSFEKRNRMIRFSFYFLSLPVYISISIDGEEKLFLCSTNLIDRYYCRNVQHRH